MGFISNKLRRWWSFATWGATFKKKHGGQPTDCDVFVFRTQKYYANSCNFYIFKPKGVQKNPAFKQPPHIFPIIPMNFEIVLHRLRKVISRGLLLYLKALGTRNGWSSIQLINIHLNEGIVHLGVETSAAGSEKLDSLIPFDGSVVRWGSWYSCWWFRNPGEYNRLRLVGFFFSIDQDLYIRGGAACLASTLLSPSAWAEV